LIANELYSEIIEKKDTECSYIQGSVRRQFKYDITYQKLGGQSKALEKRFGTYEASYSNLPCILEVLKERNPGTYTAFKETDPGYGEPRIFRRAFFSLGPYIESFRYCRPVPCVDGTFFTRKYKGTILTAIGVDANQQIFPLAYLSI